MINSINEMVSVGISAEVQGKNKNKSAAKSDESYESPDVKKSGRKDDDHSLMNGAGGEVRKSEISDGKVIIKVYNDSGKLLRKIPPGYLPLGEQKFDVTV